MHVYQVDMKTVIIEAMNITKLNKLLMNATILLDMQETIEKQVVVIKYIKIVTIVTKFT